MHPFFLYFDIIKGSAYESYSLRTVFASIVCGPWFSGVFGVRLLNPLDCSVLKENFASCLDRFVRLLDCCFVLKENFASCLDRFVRLLDCSVLRGELCFVFGSICAIIDRCSVLRGELCLVFGSICAIIGLFRSQGRTLLRVWIDLCDYWTVPFSGENFASCLDRFV